MSGVTLEGRMVVVRHSMDWQTVVLPLSVVDTAMRPKYFTCQTNGIAEFGAGVMTEQLTSR